MVGSRGIAAGPEPSGGTAGSGRPRGRGLFGRWFGGAERLGRVEFCDSCGEVCTQACRAEAHRERVRETALRSVHLPHSH
ncbi:hypothetical protein SUDANB121_02855 [Nocardiopsis dassonvillei]